MISSFPHSYNFAVDLIQYKTGRLEEVKDRGVRKQMKGRRRGEID
jgi:hypothetical protein